jgi:hypothetical protein
MSEIVERYMSRIEDTERQSEDMDLDTLEQLVRITDATDRTARRTFGLDSETHSTITLQVQSELPAQRQLEDRNEVLDVETVPNLDTPPAETVK